MKDVFTRPRAHAHLRQTDSDTSRSVEPYFQQSLSLVMPSGPVHAYNDSFTEWHIIPLIFIILILVFILLHVRPSVISLRTNHATRTRSSPRRELEVPDEEEPFLTSDEGQDVSPRQDNQPRDHTFDCLTAEIDQWKHADAMKAEEIEIAHKDIEKLQQDLLISVSQNAELQRRCETLSSDLEGARLFLSTADTYSDSEVIQMLQKLNAEVQHTSTFMADRVLNVFKIGAVTSDQGQRGVVNGVSGSIGSTLIRFLQTAQHDDLELPLYLQVTLQAYLTHRMYWIVTSWTPDEGRNAFINEIYQRLRETEKQAIAGHWRSLTRTYAHPTSASEPNPSVISIIAGLSDILLAVGCAAPRSDIASGLSSMFEKNILSTVSLAERLTQMMDGVISGDFEVFAVLPGETFRGGMMEEDVDGSQDEVQGAPVGTGTAQTVLCTSELGLTKRVQLGTGGKETKTVTKAKVILESFLQAED